MAEWFESEAIWRDTFHVSFNPAKLEAGRIEIEQLLDLTEVSNGAALDLCCGPGRHSVPLAMRGFVVTGVDRTRFLLDEARNRAAEAGVEIEFVREDMRRFERAEHFDLAFCLYHSFGYFEDRQQDRIVLGNVWRSLRPGGLFVLECAGKETLAMRFQCLTGFTTADGVEVFIRRRLRDDWGRTENETILIDGDRARAFPYAMNLYSGHEIRGLMSEVGFSEVSLYGDLTGSDYDDKATSLIAVAKK